MGLFYDKSALHNLYFFAYIDGPMFLFSSQEAMTSVRLSQLIEVYLKILFHFWSLKVVYHVQNLETHWNFIMVKIHS